MENKTFNIYFLCGQNRCRSQIAEALAKHYATENVRIDSAGLEPSSLHPFTIQAMQEIGIDITDRFSKKIDMKIFMSSSVIIKLCDDIEERCPIVPFGIRNEQWSIHDPLAKEDATMDDVRSARDEIKQKVISLLQKFGVYKSSQQSV
ncbi:arsenate reductase ArsC [Paenibacillus solisilvae]|uniref:Arsenate reductase ArsC n=1 Tax=Paenibacillus solisilvae TaxID=2486751 RepID=A0ABW0VVE0_9BACL